MVDVVFYDVAQILKLRTAIEEEDWFTAIVLSATQLERHSYRVIKEYLESLKLNPKLITHFLDRRHLRDFAGYLLAIEKIDQKEHGVIMKLNEVRNKFIHRREKEEFKRGKAAKKKYEPLINEAIKILKEKLGADRIFIIK